MKGHWSHANLVNLRFSKIYLWPVSFHFPMQTKKCTSILTFMLKWQITPKYLKTQCQVLVHLSGRLKCTNVITRCPSVRLSSVVNFHIFDFFSETTEQNSTKLDRKQDLNVLPSLCFSGHLEKQDVCPGLWLAETFSTSSLKPLERNLTKLERKQDFKVLYQVCVLGADRKNKMAALASDWLRHFRLLLWNRWAEFNKAWQEARSQRPLPSLYFWGRSEKQDGRPGFWLAETFSTSPLKLNGWTESNKTWQEARSQRPLPSLCFPGPSEKQDGRPGLWVAETFLTSSLKSLIVIQRNLTGSKISISSTKFVFLNLIGKTRWRPLPLIGWDIFDFSSETAQPNSTKLDRKQDLRQEARSQCPLLSLCFSGRLEKQDGCPGVSLAETFSTYSLKLQNGIQRNLERMQDLNVFCQVYVFQADE